MRTILILSLFFIGLYTQAESMSQKEQKEPVQVKVDDKHTGFYSFSLGGEVISPADSEEDFVKYHTSTFGMKFGAKLSQKSDFAAGVKGLTGATFLGFQYGYSFIEKSNRWVPGMDATLLIGFRRAGLEKTDDVDYSFYSNYKLAGGFELGPNLKTFISKSYALILRAGITYDVSTNEVFDLVETRAYLSLGIRKYF